MLVKILNFFLEYFLQIRQINTHVLLNFWVYFPYFLLLAD